MIGFNAASCFFPWFLKNSKRLWSETNASHAVSSCLLILRYQSPEANLLTVICRPFHEELAYSPDKVTCSKLRYAFEQRVPDVDSKSLVFVRDDVCSTAIHLNHGIILSLETNVRNALNRMSSRCWVAYELTLVSSSLIHYLHARVVVILYTDHVLIF